MSIPGWNVDGAHAGGVSESRRPGRPGRRRGLVGGRVVALALLALVGAVGVGCDDGVSDDTIEFVSLVEVRELRTAAKENPASLALLDSRSPSRFAAERITGARNVTLAQMPSNAAVDARIAAADTVVVYGEDPGDVTARGLTKRLMELDYSNVYWFREGLKGWKQAGGEVEGTGVTP